MQHALKSDLDYMSSPSPSTGLKKALETNLMNKNNNNSNNGGNNLQHMMQVGEPLSA